MIKNTASQSISAQMVSATDGSAFTGAVTVYVTGDRGTQAVGSVGSGACTHEGEGLHSYGPAQAETNYDHIAFTFKGTGAIPVTVQVFTVAGDPYTRLGAPAGASIAADIVVIDDFVDALESRLTATRAGYLDNLSAGAVATQVSVDTVDDFLDTEIAAIKAKTDNLPTDPADQSAVESAITTAQAAILAKMLKYVQLTLRKDAAIATDNATEVTAINADGGSGAGAFANTTDAQEALRDRGDAAWVTATGFSTLDAAGVRSALGLASANLDTQLSTIDDFLDTEIAAIKAKTDNLPTDPADASDIATSFSSITSTLATIAGYLDTEVAAIKAKTDNLPTDPADESALEAAITAAQNTVTAAISALNNLSAAQVNAEVVDALATDVIADSVPADGSRPTIAQALYLLTQFMTERSVSSTTMTVKKPDGSTTLMTFTLDSATAPTSITRAS